MLTTTKGAGADRVTMLIYGGPGVGKTTLCGTTGDDEGTLLISAEAGLMPLRHREIAVWDVTAEPEGQRYEAIRHGLSLAREDRWRWICVDSLSEIAEITLASEMRRNKDPRAAYGETATRMLSLIRYLRDLPKNVVLLCKQDRIEAEGRMLYGPLMPGKQLGKHLPHLVDQVFALRTQPGEDGAVVRWLQTVNDGVYQAKDRSGVLDSAEAPSLAAITQKIITEAAGA